MTQEHGLGWLPDVPDIRDYRLDNPEVLPLLALPAAIPPSMDFRAWASPIEDQGQLGSCTAHAAVGCIEYLERRAYGKHIDASRLFVYKVTREMAGRPGDTGAHLRETMRALALVGAPPEDAWPYRVATFDREPSKLAYALAANWKALKYFRVDRQGASTATTLAALKAVLATSVPVMFGWAVYQSINRADPGGKIPFPDRKTDRLDGGHACAMFGYDDAMKIEGETGAFIIRNSWGETWGDGGYGYLPYRYVLDSLADDYWAIQSQAFVDSGQFG